MDGADSQGTSSRARELEPLMEHLDRCAPSVLLRFGIPEIEWDDLLQDVLTAYWRSRRRIRDPQRWLLGALRNLCFQFLRRTSTRKRRPYREDLGLLQVLMGSSCRQTEERILLQMDLDTALSRLREKQRRILVLRFRQGFSPAEVAELLGYRRSSMKKVTNRALHALRKELRESG